MSYKHAINYILSKYKYISTPVYFDNSFHVIIIEFKLTYEASFIQMTDNLSLSSHFHFSFFIKFPTGNIYGVLI